MKITIYLILFLSCCLAQARVFQFNSETVAAYFAGTAGDATTVGTTPFSKISGSNTTYNAGATPSYTQSFEFGFLMTMKEAINLKFGAELFKVPTNSSIVGSDATGTTKWFDLVSDLSVFNPNLSMEFNFIKLPDTRHFFYLNAGYGQMTLKNTYTVTTAGRTALSVGASVASVIKSNFINYQLGYGYETLFVDNVTFNFMLGYRYMDVLDTTFGYDGDHLGSGAATSGAAVLDNYGNPFKISMSGFNIALGFRFYIETR